MDDKRRRALAQLIAQLQGGTPDFAENLAYQQRPLTGQQTGGVYPPANGLQHPLLGALPAVANQGVPERPLIPQQLTPLDLVLQEFFRKEQGQPHIKADPNSTPPYRGVYKQSPTPPNVAMQSIHRQNLRTK